MAEKQSDEDRIADIERVLYEEAQRGVKYDDTNQPGWVATAFPIRQSSGPIAGPLTGIGATRLEAAESLLAEWRKRVAGPQG